MQATISIPVPDTSMTPHFACLLSAASAQPSNSTGKERDTESGNDYFVARYYSSAMGRFMSPDWSAKAEPVPYSKLDDPQSLNLYAYVRNNPLGSVDADGHAPLSWGGFENCASNNSSTTGCAKAVQARQQEFKAEREAMAAAKAQEEQAKQARLQSQFHATFPNSSINADKNNGGYYKIQGGHGEQGASITLGDLSKAGFAPYRSPFGNDNGYRDETTIMGIHVNGTNGSEMGSYGHNLSEDVDPVHSPDDRVNGQVHFDVGNARAGLLGMVVHTAVDVVLGTVLGGTSLDPR